MESCPDCGSASLSRDRVAGARADVDAVMCLECLEWWFEVDGVRLTVDSMPDLGVG